MTSPDPLPRLLEPFVERPESAAVLSDFDGTLSLIVDEPADARPLPGVLDVVRRLAASRLARVGIVTGRPAAFVAGLVPVAGLWIAGLHGMERVVDGVTVTDAEAQRWQPAIEDVARASERDGPPGLKVERKTTAVTLHFREDPGRRAAAEAWAAAEARRTGLVVHPARMSFELRPPVPIDKGVAVDDAIAGLAAAAFLGDDAGDLLGFDALDRLERRGGNALRVAVGSVEAPPELIARADVVVDGPPGSLALLERLADALG